MDEAGMDEAEARSRMARARVGRLATVGRDGVPHLVPLVFVLLGDRLYSAVDQKPKSTRRLRRLSDIAATGQAGVLVDHYDEEWSQLWWVRVSGRARVLAEDGAEGVRAIDALAAKYPQYARERPRGPVLAVEELTWRWWSAR